MTSSQSLRKSLRQVRRALSAQQQVQHSHQACRLFMRSRWAQRPKRIALFLSQDGEMSTKPLIQKLWHRAHQVYLPVVLESGLLKFALYLPDSELVANRFGIEEPITRPSDWLDPKMLVIVIMPLVGFDLQGHRLGMGGGFYDKTFAFKRHMQRKPTLIGWAHQCQQVESLPCQPWDVAMDALITEQGVFELPQRMRS